MKPILILILLFTFKISAQNKGVLKNELLKFVPKNYTLLSNTKGDLNNDKYPDYVLVLSKINEEETSKYGDDKPEKRPLLLLLGNAKNKLTKAAININTVLCYDCGAAMGDPYEGVTIKNGSFSIHHYGGTSWRWTRTITYTYSKTEKNWFLYEDKWVSFHASNPNKIEEERVKTEKDFGKIKFEDYSIYE